MNGDLQGKVVLITGASAGIGRAAARLFGSMGAKVALMARGEKRLQDAVEAIEESGGQAFGFPGDAASKEDCRAALEAIKEKWGQLDILVNNAGLHHRGPFLDNDPEELARMIQVNLESPIYLTRIALPYLLQQGGAIVNVASLAGCIPVPDSATYSSSKFGLRAFSLALRTELENKGVTVSLVSPGPVSTGFILDELDQVTDITLSQPMVSAEHVAEAIVACALDGRRERKLPFASGVLTTLGYLYPSLKRILRPLLEWKGARAKRALQAMKNRGTLPGSSDGTKGA